MKKKIFIFACFIGLFLLNGSFVYAYYRNSKVIHSQERFLKDLEALDSYSQEELNSLVGGNALSADIKLVDGRSANLKRYLRSINSPLFEHTDTLVSEADEKGYDYRLLVAIACQESTCCKRIPPGSHNCWGWGIYGDKVTTFESYDEAIRTVSSGIKTNYIDKGLVTTERIMNKYNPSSTGHWAWAIRFFFNKIENY